MIQDWIMLHGEWLLFGFLILCFGFLLLRQHFINSAPEFSGCATVESRRLGTARFHSRWSSGWNHLVTFRFDDGDTIELYTSESEYGQLREGLSVTITWQNENLLRFEPNT